MCSKVFVLPPRGNVCSYPTPLLRYKLKNDVAIAPLFYSLALVVMAACAVATGDRLVGVGGVLFLVSDLLIGLRAADVSIPASGVLVMSTYAAAQVLITVGWVALVRSRHGAQQPVVTG